VLLRLYVTAHKHTSEVEYHSKAIIRATNRTSIQKSICVHYAPV